MTPQEVFTKVATHLLTQNAKAINYQNKCQYRAPNGLTCAVGCLIPDTMYKHWFEGRSIEFILTDELLPLFEPNLALLQRLQKIHDFCSVENWPYALRNVAGTYNLEMPT